MQTERKQQHIEFIESLEHSDTPFGRFAKEFLLLSATGEDIPSPSELFQMIDHCRAIAKYPQLMALFIDYLSTIENNQLNDN